DVVTVSAVDFLGQDQALAPVPDISFAEHLMRHLGTIINGAVALLIAWLLIWYGVRPMVNTMRETAVATTEGGQLIGAGAGENGGEFEVLASDNSGLVEDYQRRNENSPQERLRRLIEMDELQAAA